MDDRGRDRREASRLLCESCGADLPDESRFCNKCGAPVVPHATSAEYKQVTVLFADIVHSMDIAASLDPERWREIMSELADRSAAAVRRYGGTVEYTGDGVMALFGAPVALEDHAFRACLAALAIQQETNWLAGEVARRDAVELQVRVGLNSGRVIAGEIGSGAFGYVAVGEQVGMAQRMESVASPGGVMLSESTAGLVDHLTVLSDWEWVRIKGVDAPVRARRLVSIGAREGRVGRAEASLIGRRGEMAALSAGLGRAVGGRGDVVTVVGPPGIGKSRLARETAALAAGRGVRVVWTFGESHTRDIPFAVVRALLRTVFGIADLDDLAARDRLRTQAPDPDPQDLLLLADLLGIADPEVPLPQLDSDARRRRLTALMGTTTSTHAEPVLFIIEDAHWIDAASESMLTDFVSGTTSMVLITSRPEYRGGLTRVPGAQSIVLEPLGDSDTAALIGELLGAHPSVRDLAALIAERAAGNPFFAEEMVRELVQRGVLVSGRDGFVSRVDVAEVTVPVTVHAAIAARIDRLSTPARRTLNAASVIGARIEEQLLVALGIDSAIDELLGAELIEQTSFSQNAEYAFRHPLIRAVVYESQLKSDRAELHRRLAAAIETLGKADSDAALIAQHVEAAGDSRAAYGWHMRAGAWTTNRDLVAARASWVRACSIADSLPADAPDRLSMRIAPRTMLCATDWQAREVHQSRSRFEELRELCGVAGDTVSLAIGMTGLVTDLVYSGRTAEGARVSAQQMALLDSIDDPTPVMGLPFIAFVNWLGVGDFGEILKRSQSIIDLADGDPVKGAGFGVGSPLAIASAWRGTARWWLGRPGWRQDLHDAVALARRSNPETFACAMAWTYGFAMQYGVLRADAGALPVIEEAVRTANRASSDRAMGLAGYTLAVWLLNRTAATYRDRGLELMTQCREIWLRKRAQFLLPVTDVWASREAVRRGDRDAAVSVMRGAVEALHDAGNLFYGAWGTGVLVQTLLDRGGGGDAVEARELTDRLSVRWADDGSAMREMWLLRLRTLLTRADETDNRDHREHYRAMAESLGFEGHLAWADEMFGARK